MREERRAEPVDVDARHEKVCVFRLDAQSLVPHRAADDVRPQIERAHVLLDALRHPEGASAIASISTRAPDGSFATSTVDRAGGVAPTCFAYTSFMPAKSSRFCRKTVVLTSWSSDEPASSRIARRFAKTCSVCGVIPPSTIALSPGRRPSWPETNTNPLALIACEYGAPWNGAGAVSVRTASLLISAPA